VRRGFLKELPALSRFFHGAISPLNVDEFTLRELSAYVTYMNAQKALNP
jgi:hypothetical protein